MRPITEFHCDALRTPPLWRRMIAALGNSLRGAFKTPPAVIFPELKQWARELRGNELIRLPGWFGGLETIEGVCRGETRLSLHPDGRYCLSSLDPSQGSWRLRSDDLGRPTLVLKGDTGCLTDGPLGYDPQDPTAIYFRGKRFLARFTRGYLAAARSAR